MRFEDFKYERPNMETFKSDFTKALETFTNAEAADKQEKAMDEINRLRFDFNTMSTLASIRNSIDTRDEFYDAEKQFFNKNSPIFSQLNNQFYKALSEAKFKTELMERKGKLLFEQAEQSLRTFADSIMDDLGEENRLSNEHQKLLASAEIEFEGETRNLSQMAPFAQSAERSMRKRASKAASNFFKEHEETLDKLYDDLVKVRTTIANKIGYETFTELAYERLGRLDYGPKEVANYRKQVEEIIVPINTELSKRKQARLELDELWHYDLPLDYKSGNATPKGDKDTLIKAAKVMYDEMSKETSEFFNVMLDRNLMDLESKKGKAGGGYCTFIPNYDSPFIFANFNGTKHDVDVLTHEAGHAFQMYSSRHHEVPEYLMATMEASEIHSMSMEFFAWPWIDKFFKEDTDKYKFSHLSQALMLITYGVSIDEFQHEVYAKPSMTPKERRELWRSIEKKYFPYRKYDDDQYLESGGGWHRIMHIFAVPFYMIDYTLAQVCAFQFWVKSQKDYDKAWEDYLRLCKTGGSKTFLNLLDVANLENPFADGTLEKTVPHIKAYLDKVDDSSF